MSIEIPKTSILTLTPEGRKVECQESWIGDRRMRRMKVIKKEKRDVIPVKHFIADLDRQRMKRILQKI